MGRDDADTFVVGRGDAYDRLEEANGGPGYPGVVREVWERDRGHGDEWRSRVVDPEHPEEAWIDAPDDDLIADPDAQPGDWP